MKNLITCLTVCVLSGAAFADTIHVPKQYPTIQVAINASMNGDEILVAPGTYNESIDYNGRAISIIGTGGSSVTTLVGQNVGYPIKVNGVNPGSCRFSGFTISATEDYLNELAFCNDSIFSLDDCKFLHPQNRGALYINGGCTVTLTSCLFENSSRALLVTTSNDVTITNTIFKLGGEAIYINGSNNSVTYALCTFDNLNTNSVINTQVYSTLSFSQCLFQNNTTTSETLELNSNDTLSNCTFENNTTGISVIMGSPLTINNCTVANNESSIAAVYISGNSTTISNTTFCENTVTDVVGNWINGGGNEFLADCGDVEGACCVDDNCYEVEQLFCDSIAGEWQGFNVTCVEDTCSDPPQFGACCINGEAVALYDYDCYRIFGAFMGEGTDPADVTCPLVCAEDVNADGVINVSDLLAIISVWGACQ